MGCSAYFLTSVPLAMQQIRWTMWAPLLLQIAMFAGLSSSAVSGTSVLLTASLLSSAPAPAPAPTSTTNRSEVAALLDLRGELGIRKIYWPRRQDPCSTWEGIECDGGHVVGIQLAGLRRTVKAAMHPEFALDALQRLPLLRRVNASGFALPGTIPAWFGSLSNLQVLDFTSALINGSIPSALGGLFNLRILILAHNKLTGNIPSTFGELNRLTFLDLSFNGLSGPIPVTVANLTSLTVMNFTGNYLDGSIPSLLGGLVLLNRLDLGSNVLSGPIPVELGRLTALNTLILSNNSLSGSIPIEIMNCTELQILAMDANHLNGTLPIKLSSLKNISILNFSYNNLTGLLSTGLSTLLEMKELILSHNLFYGPLPPGLTNLSMLVTLDISYNYFNGSLSGFRHGTLFEENCLSGVQSQRNFSTCKSFYSERDLSFQGTIVGPSPAPQIAVENISKSSKHLAAILGGVFGGLGLVFIIMLLAFLLLKWQRHTETTERNIGSASQRGGAQQFPGAVSVNLFYLGEQFTYTQLLQATGEFNASNLLKGGHSGDLYQGLLEGGVPIVVKRIVVGKLKKDAYMSELEFFAKASHTRLVPLLGYCLEHEEEKLLVYKYMPNRDLAYALHRRTSASPPKDTLQSLDWITRLKIAIGAAEGLTYLHHECTPPLVHRDVQASSILLDDKFEVRLGSLTEACLAEEAQHRVIARILRMPQTSDQGEAGAPAATCAYDVFCFGKVLLELVSGKLGISGLMEPNAEAWLERALPLINTNDKESVVKLVDPSLIVDEDLLEEVWAMAIVAKSCLNPKPSKRPLMRYILKALENPLKVVREDASNGSRRLRTSSIGSWNNALFGSWRHSSSETVTAGSLKEEHGYKSSSKRIGNGGSQGSGQGEMSHRRAGSNEIFPEPVEDSAVQTPNTDSEQQEN